MFYIWRTALRAMYKGAKGKWILIRLVCRFHLLQLRDSRNQ